MLVVRFSGPHKFYRMAGWSGKDQKMSDPYGCWWVDEAALTAVYSKIERLDMYEGWIPTEILSQIKSLPLHYRALTAVCKNWNDFREQVMLELPVNEELVGLWGSIAPQPLIDPKPHVRLRALRKMPWLPGGVDQVYFKSAPKAERDAGRGRSSINPFWVRWINLW